MYMVTNLPLFGTQDSSTFDIAIASYKITPFLSSFMCLHYMYIHRRGNGRGITPIILRRILSDLEGPYGIPHCLAMFLFFQSTGTARDCKFYGRGYRKLFVG